MRLCVPWGGEGGEDGGRVVGVVCMFSWEGDEGRKGGMMGVRYVLGEGMGSGVVCIQCMCFVPVLLLFKINKKLMTKK